jgi:hypothetical protein
MNIRRKIKKGIKRTSLEIKRHITKIKLENE